MILQQPPELVRLGMREKLQNNPECGRFVCV